jgi:mannose/fructose/N-acetylgalactosamine-specific phosphotransferase system component IIC
MNRDAIDATAAALGTKAAYTGATTTIGSWMLSSEFGVLAGLMIGVLGLLTNLYFQHRRDRREEREHQRRMDRMASQKGDLT